MHKMMIHYMHGIKQLDVLEHPRKIEYLEKSHFLSLSFNLKSGPL